MGQALYRKYRTKSLQETVGQEHITRTLEHALANGHISHAYLFTGPRGVGKTSVARILAHAINDLPYTDDSTHLDIIEIDAASNRRIDEIRELRDKVYVAPVSARYKVYIIDEVHMLTKEAFNALLKTLEEPPAHVVFILATTDAHKLPETIVSRTQRFTFKPVEKTKVAARLKEIAETEKITISDPALELLAEYGEGSFRDSISLLDQARNQAGKLEADNVLALLGVPPTEAIQNLLELLAAGTSPGVLFQQISSLFTQGYQATVIAKQLAKRLRQQLINDELSIPLPTAMELLRELIAVPAAQDAEHFLEIILLQAVQTKHPSLAVEQTRPTSNEQEEATPTAQAETASTYENAPSATPKVPAPAPPASKQVPAADQSVRPLDGDSWQPILEALKQQHRTLYGVARMAEPSFTADGTLRLSFKFAFHQKRLKESKNRELLTTVAEQVTGHKLKLECVVDEHASSPTSPPENETTGDLVTINNIFGGGELLES